LWLRCGWDAIQPYDKGKKNDSPQYFQGKGSSVSLCFSLYQKAKGGTE
jgi:hypothetical protein